MKVHLSPRFRGADEGDGGIRRVVEAQRRHLPAHGFEVVERAEDADVLGLHAGQLEETGAPMVAHNHGLYWTAEEDWPYWAWKLNRDVIEVLRRADAVTAPSEWVAQSMRRGMLLDPVVIPHGVDTDEWTPPKDGGDGYVLWNKTRTDPVCDPEPVAKLAEIAPAGQRFVTTFGQPRPNVQVIGRVPYDEMRAWVRTAGVYLATPRETFGIGTLEAMACGVPVLGWAWGGQLDIVDHGETGYLAEPGNYEDLEAGLAYCLANRKRLGLAAREAALRFTWEAACEMYAAVYEGVLDTAATRRKAPRTSVVVPCHNHAQFLEACVGSVLEQTDQDLEVVIVDDCSPDNTAQVAADLCSRDQRVRYLKTPQNLYLAGARNYGIERAHGRYVLPLDADDMLPPEALTILAGSLDADAGLHIAYGHMEVLEQDGRVERYDWPARTGFDWRALMLPKRQGLGGHNQNPYSSLFRREVWEHTGGYRTRVRTAEDADFWVRATSYGFVARKVTEASVLLKRDHKDSMGYTEPEPDWLAWFGWSRNLASVPFGSIGPPPDGRLAWPIASHERPEVSVVIPVGPGHETKVGDALDSLVAQGISDWEAIVVDDTGSEPGPDLRGFPWAYIVKTLGTAEGSASDGPAAARNAGLAVARGQWVVFLDADDYLQPDFLAETLSEGRHCDEVVYTDWIAQHADGSTEPYEVPNHEDTAILRRQQFAVTALYPRAALEEVGGFDETITEGWEDWDLHIALRARGYCGVRVPRPLLTYRIHTGSLRESAFANKDHLRERVLQKWGRFYDGTEPLMPCTGCGGRRSAPAPAAAAQTRVGGNTVTGEVTLVEYSGQNPGKFRVRGRASRQQYTFGRDGFHERMYVRDEDVADLVALPDFMVVEPVVGVGSPEAEPIVAHEVGAAPEAPPAPPAEDETKIPAGQPLAGGQDGAAEPPGTAGADAAANLDPSKLTIDEIGAAARAMGGRGLEQMLAMERAYKNRKGAVQALETALNAAAEGAATPE